MRPPATKKPARKAAKPAAAWFPGKMGKSETVPLAIAAREAYDYQQSLGLTDGQSFDDWRRAQVLEVTGCEGLSKCSHPHFQPLMGHFKTLSGDDAAAFQALMKTGAQSDAADAGSHEQARGLAYEICAALQAHIELADIPLGELAEKIEGHDDYFRAKQRKESIQAKGGPVREGYLVSIVRSKTRRPDLKLGRDLQAGLAERCTVEQLRQILSTLVNRINAREGVGQTANRNKKQRSTAAKAARDPGELAPRVPPLD